MRPDLGPPFMLLIGILLPLLPLKGGEKRRAAAAPAGPWMWPIALGGVAASVPDNSTTLEIIPRNLDFGDLKAGQTALASLQLVNRGSSRARGDLICRGNGFAIRRDGGTFGARFSFDLAPRQAVGFHARFAAASGMATGELVVEQSPGESVLAMMRCRGGLPLCVIEPEHLAFGPVKIRDVMAQTFKIANQGTGVLRANFRGDGEAAEFTFTTASGSNLVELEPGQSRIVSVQFQPQSPGPRDGRIHCLGQDCAPVTLEGVGVAADTACTVVPGYFDFGHVELGDSRTLTFTLVNLGSAPLAGAVSAPRSDQFRIEGGEGAYRLDSGQTRTVTVTFVPCQVGGCTCDLPLGHPACATVTCFGSGRGVGDSPPPLASAPQGRLEDGVVLLSWKVGDDPENGYHAYRRKGLAAPRRLTEEPLRGGGPRLQFRDPAAGVPLGAVLHYSYATIACGEEINRSRELAVTYDGNIPAASTLCGNYPNPFKGVTTIQSELARAGTCA